MYSLVVLRLRTPLLLAALHDRLLLLRRLDGGRDRRPLAINNLDVVLLRPFAADDLLKRLYLSEWWIPPVRPPVLVLEALFLHRFHEVAPPRFS